ncbi:MerR family transcriptional regulator [Chloroflexi bacterium TSY]|nr:MerR family transcriptional regulator [Chloroflexi bacterium TSY]
MLQIGTFARIGQVSVKTLHHYEKLGLLVPDYVDQFTNYRYYSYRQVARLNRILALKDLGLSLDQVAEVLKGTLSADELRGMLRLKRIQLAEQMQAMQAQLERVEARLIQIELEGKMPNFEVVLKTIDPMIVAGRRIIVTENNDFPVGLGEAFKEACDYVQAHGKQTGPGIAIWYTPVDTKEAEDVEAAYPIEQEIAGTDRVKVHELPQELAATVMFEGDFKKFMEGYDAVLKWIDLNNYRVTGPFREVYHKFDGQTNEDVAVEIQFPVAKAG